MTVLDREQVLSAFKNRKSCRHYDAARKISAEDFQFILELGRLSPSSVGSEPWQFVVVQNPEIRQAVKPFSWGMADALDTASHLVVFWRRKMPASTARLCWKASNGAALPNRMP